MATSLFKNVFFKIPSRCGQLLLCRRTMCTIKLNEQFYQQILRDHEKDTSIIVKNLVAQPACEKGSSFVSVVDRVKVFGVKTGSDYQKSLIVKKLPPEEQMKLYRSNIAVENENNAYKKIIPLLKKHSGKPLPIADCVYANDEVIILEDLGVNGFTPVNKSKGGLTIEQCKIVLKGLAQIHAASFVLERKEPQNFSEISKLTKEMLFHGGDSELLEYQTQYMSHAISVFKSLPVNDEHKKCIQLLEDLKENSRARIKNLLFNPRENSVICHGDAWVGNIMFNNNSELRLIDLQLMRYNSVATDLAYLLYVNLVPEVLFVNMGNLLNVYLSNLKENIKNKGLNLDAVLTEDWIKREMSTFSEYGVVYGLWVMPAFYIKKEEFEITKEQLSDTSGVSKRAGNACDERLKKLILGYVRNVM